MDEKLLLEAIGQMMNEKLKENNQILKKEIINEVNVVIEDKVTREIRLIAEGHRDIIQRLPDINEQDQLKSRVRMLERVVVDLRKEVEDLKKAN